MKNIKKLGKRMLCSMIALVCMLSASLPVYAGGGGTVRGDEVLVLSYYDYSTDSKGNVEKTYFRELYAIGGGNMYPVVVVDSNFSKGGLIVGICDSSAGQYGVKNQSTALKTSTVSDGTTSMGSSISALAFFKKMSGVYDKKDCTWYQYLINSGISKDDIEKYLSEVNMCLGYSIGMRDWNDSNREITVATSKYNVMELYYYIVSLYQKEKPWEKEDVDTDHLPMLTYSLKRTTVVGFPSITEIMENLSWDYTEKELYKDNPTKYNIEILISANWKKAPTGIGNIRDVSNMQFNDKAKHYISSAVPIVENSYKWRYSQQGKELYKKAGENWGDESGYNLFIRTYEVGGSKVSYWKVYNLALGGYVQQEDTLIDENGNKVPISKDDYDIGNTEHDGKNKDDQSSSAPYSSDNKASTDNDPNSDSYRDNGNYSIDSFLGSIKNVINTISGIPSLLSSLASWLDPRLITLITASIALVVSIGVVKMIL